MTSRAFIEASTAAQARHGSEFRVFAEPMLTYRSRANQHAGEQIVRNIGDECHLTGDAPFGDHTQFSEFIANCIQIGVGTAPSELPAEFANICENYLLSGTRIDRSCVPDELLRYTANRSVAMRAVERILGPIILADVIDGYTPLSNALSDVATVWNPALMHESDMIAGGNVTFATFVHSHFPTPLTAQTISDALALPLYPRRPGDAAELFEMRYPTDEVTPLRFPTVADAGLCELFRPARDEPPTQSHHSSCIGWTNPRNGERALPEVVHKNESLRILTTAPQSIGTIQW